MDGNGKVDAEIDRTIQTAAAQTFNKLGATIILKLRGN